VVAGRERWEEGSSLGKAQEEVGHVAPKVGRVDLDADEEVWVHERDQLGSEEIEKLVQEGALLVVM